MAKIITSRNSAEQIINSCYAIDKVLNDELSQVKLHIPEDEQHETTLEILYQIKSDLNDKIKELEEND